MPLTVMDRVNQACAEQHALDPTRGPRFEYNMGAGAKITELPLDQQIQSWRNEQATQIQQSAGLPSSPAGGAVASGDLAAALSCIGPVEQGALSSLLARLRSTAHYRIAPENMIERVNTLIGQLLGDPSALQGATALAVEATETCDDRVALGLMMMEEALIERQAYGTEKFKPSLKEVATTGLGLFKSKHLQEIAHKKASSIVGFLDETEIVLKYITRLSKPLELPCPLDDMIFHGCATAVSEQDIAHAQQAVRAEVKREGALEQYLAGWGPWQAAIQRNAPELHQRIKQKIEQINENFYDCVDAGMQELATEQGKTPPDAQRVIELEAQQGKLMIERRQALLKPWLLATRELLEKESL